MIDSLEVEVLFIQLSGLMAAKSSLMAAKDQRSAGA
jgi:hypothetical protein